MPISQGWTGEAEIGILEETSRFESTPGSFSPTTKLSFDTFLEEERLDAMMIEQGIERSDRAASYLLLKAEDALRRGEGEEAVRLGKMAAKVSPLSPLPPFFLADTYWRTDKRESITALSYYLKGLELALDDVLFLLPILSKLLLFSLVAILLSTLTFIFYSLISYAPLWVHQISEKSNGYLNPISSSFFFAIIFFGPFILGLPILWFGLFSFLLFWHFYTRGEKGIVFTILIALGATTWVLPFLLTLFTARDSLLIDEMVRNHYSDYLWTPSPTEPIGSEWEGWFIQASYKAQRGDYKKATLFYQNALSQNPQSALILNNLGNLSFYSKDYQRAVKYYQEAIKTDPFLVSAHFNLSQTYREMLMFGKGENLFVKAKTINEKTAKRYAMKAARHPAFPVIEERFLLSDLWKRLLKKNGESVRSSEDIWQNWAGFVSLNKAPLIAASWAVLLIISSFAYKRFFSAIPCAFCKKAICKHCAERLFSYEVCDPCRKRYRSIQKKSDFKIIEDIVIKVPRRLYPLFFLPGGGYLVIRRTKLACLFLFVFYMTVSAFLLGEVFLPPVEWYLHRPGSYLPKVLLSISCLAAFIDLTLKRRARKWL